MGLLGAPPDFDSTLGEVPQGAVLSRRPKGGCDLVLWFVRGLRELESGIEGAVGLMAEGGGLWIAWPKQASGVATDVKENHVRECGLAAGMVDYKVAAIDATWSGLKFARRR